jgi:hypothetical protein
MRNDTEKLREMVLAVDVFCACIETGLFPTHGSPCHRKARELVDKSGCKPVRHRRRLPRIRKNQGAVARKGKNEQRDGQ